MTARVHRLSNGVRVVCDPMAGLESAAVSVVIGGGARWEDPAHNGWSHLLEHMVFKGAGARSALQIVETVEARGGHLNAATGYERTSYQLRCLADALPEGLEILADLVRHPTLAPDDLTREVAVVGQEIAEAADTPDDRVFDLAQTQAFAGQSLGRPILGSEATIGATTVDTLRRFHHSLYGPERMVVAAAGAVDEAQLLQRVEALFGDASTSPAPLPAPAPARFEGGEAVEARNLEQAHLVFLMPAAGARDPDYFATRLFAEILGGGMSSRLFQTVREERGLAYAIDAYAETYADTGVLGVYAGCAAADAAETARLTAQEAVKLAAGAQPAELARAKAQTKGQLFMGREAPLNRAEQAAGQVLLFDQTFSPEALAEAVDAVTLDDLKRVGERALAGRVIAALGPKRAGTAPEAFRKGLSLS